MSDDNGVTSARAALAGRGYAVGMWVLTLSGAEVIWVLARSGVDFVYLDMEHSAFGMDTVAAQLAAAQAAGVTAIVRPPSKDYPIGRLLDLGAMGVLVPGVEHERDIEWIVAESKYTPVGNRSVATFGPHTRYRPLDDEYLFWANRETIVIAQFESARAFERIDEILAVPGLDVAVVGRNDLSHDLGVPGSLDGPEVTHYVELLIDRCTAHGVIPGLLVGNASAAVDWLAKGVRWLPVGSEVSALAGAAAASVAAVHERAGAAFAVSSEGATR
jgi:2-keto-3-deoxy-L-rhamnonate aldolase RhmA